MTATTTPMIVSPSNSSVGLVCGAEASGALENSQTKDMEISSPVDTEAIPPAATATTTDDEPVPCETGDSAADDIEGEVDASTAGDQTNEDEPILATIAPASGEPTVALVEEEDDNNEASEDSPSTSSAAETEAPEAPQAAPSTDNTESVESAGDATEPKGETDTTNATTSTITSGEEDIQEQRRQEQRESIEEGEKPNQTVEYLRKGAVATLGGTMVGLGLVMIPLPTPFGAVIASSGMAVLGTEFQGAKELNEKIIDKTKTSLETAREHVIRSIESMDDGSFDKEDKEDEDDGSAPGAAVDDASSGSSSSDDEEDEVGSKASATSSAISTSVFMNPAERKRQEELAAAREKQLQQSKKKGNFYRDWKKNTHSYLSKNLVPLLKNARIGGQKDGPVPVNPSIDASECAEDGGETAVSSSLEPTTPRLKELEDLFKSNSISSEEYALRRQRVFREKTMAVNESFEEEATPKECGAAEAAAEAAAAADGDAPESTNAITMTESADARSEEDNTSPDFEAVAVAAASGDDGDTPDFTKTTTMTETTEVIVR